MQKYIQHQLSIEICASEALAVMIANAKPGAEKENTHVMRAAIKNWLSEVPTWFRSGENTVPASTAMTEARTACIKFATAACSGRATSKEMVAAADHHFMRYFFPLLHRMHNANVLYDTPIALLPAAAPASNLLQAMTGPPTFTHEIHPFSHSTPESDDEESMSMKG